MAVELRLIGPPAEVEALRQTLGTVIDLSGARLLPSRKNPSDERLYADIVIEGAAAEETGEDQAAGEAAPVRRPRRRTAPRSRR